MMAQASQGEKRKRSPRKNPSPVKRLRVSSELGCEVGARWDVQTGQVLDFDIKEEPDDEEFLQLYGPVSKSVPFDKGSSTCVKTPPDENKKTTTTVSKRQTSNRAKIQSPQLKRTQSLSKSPSKTPKAQRKSSNSNIKTVAKSSNSAKRRSERKMSVKSEIAKVKESIAQMEERIATWKQKNVKGKKGPNESPGCDAVPGEREQKGLLATNESEIKEDVRQSVPSVVGEIKSPGRRSKRVTCKDLDLSEDKPTSSSRHCSPLKNATPKKTQKQDDQPIVSAIRQSPRIQQILADSLNPATSVSNVVEEAQTQSKVNLGNDSPSKKWPSPRRSKRSLQESENKLDNVQCVQSSSGSTEKCSKDSPKKLPHPDPKVLQMIVTSASPSGKCRKKNVLKDVIEEVPPNDALAWKSPDIPKTPKSVLHRNPSMGRRSVEKVKRRVKFSPDKPMSGKPVKSCQEDADQLVSDESDESVIVCKVDDTVWSDPDIAPLEEDSPEPSNSLKELTKGKSETPEHSAAIATDDGSTIKDVFSANCGADISEDKPAKPDIKVKKKRKAVSKNVKKKISNHQKKTHHSNEEEQQPEAAGSSGSPIGPSKENESEGEPSANMDPTANENQTQVVLQSSLEVSSSKKEMLKANSEKTGAQSKSNQQQKATVVGRVSKRLQEKREAKISKAKTEVASRAGKQSPKEKNSKPKTIKQNSLSVGAISSKDLEVKPDHVSALSEGATLTRHISNKECSPTVVQPEWAPEPVGTTVDVEGPNLPIIEAEMDSPSKNLDWLTKELTSLNKDSVQLMTPPRTGRSLTGISPNPKSPKQSQTPKKTPIKVNFQFKTPTKTPPRRRTLPVTASSRSPVRFIGRFSSAVTRSPLGIEKTSAEPIHKVEQRPVAQACASIIEIIPSATPETAGQECRALVPSMSATTSGKKPTRRELDLGQSSLKSYSSRKGSGGLVKRSSNTLARRGPSSLVQLGDLSVDPRESLHGVGLLGESEGSSSPVVDSPHNRLQIVEEEFDSFQDFDDKLMSRTQSIELTVNNVKSIIRQVITNEHVLDMVRNTIQEEGLSDQLKEAIFEPKMTRLRAKEVREKGTIAGIWPLSPVKAPPPKPAESAQLLEMTFSENEDEDDDYHPSEHDSGDETESLLSSQASECGSPRSRLGSTPTIGTPHTPQTSVFLKPDSQSTPKMVLHNKIAACQSWHGISLDTPSAEHTEGSQQSLIRVLHTTSRQKKKEIIGVRTRSKLSLEDTPLEQLEADFVAPDITPDLYDTTCDTEEYQTFLMDLMKTEIAGEPNETVDDENNDPDYNFLDKQEEDHDTEDYRTDRAVKVSKKEWNELMDELFEAYADCLEDETSQDGFLDGLLDNNIIGKGTSSLDEGSKPKVGDKSKADGKPKFGEKPKSSGKPKVGEKTKIGGKPKLPPLGDIIPHMCTVDTSWSCWSRLLVKDLLKDRELYSKAQKQPEPEPAADVNITVPEISPAEMIQLHDQMRKHTQLLAQSVVLAGNSDAFAETKVQASKLLEELYMLGKTFLTDIRQRSAFHATDLQGARAIIGMKLDEEQDKYLTQTAHERLHRMSWKRSTCRPVEDYALSWSQMKLFYTNTTFIFPQMLPEIKFHSKSVQKHKIFSEAEDNLLLLGVDQFGLKGVEHIQKLLLPTKTQKKITGRLKHLRGKKSGSDNSLKTYLKDNKLPELERYLSLEDEADICSPEERDPVLLPVWSEVFQAVSTELKNGTIVINSDEPSKSQMSRVSSTPGNESPATNTDKQKTSNSTERKGISGQHRKGFRRDPHPKKKVKVCSLPAILSSAIGASGLAQVIIVKTSGESARIPALSAAEANAADISLKIPDSTTVPSVPTEPTIIMSTAQLQQFAAQLVVLPASGDSECAITTCISTSVTASQVQSNDSPLVRSVTYESTVMEGERDEGSKCSEVLNVTSAVAHENLMSTASVVMSPAPAMLSAHQHVMSSANAVMSPAHQHVMSPASAVMSPAHEHVMSPAQQHVLSPASAVMSAQQHVMSPANAVMSPAHQHVMSPASAVMSPAHEHVMSPAHQNVMSPAHQNVMSPANAVMSSAQQHVMSPANAVMSPAHPHVMSSANAVMSPAHQNVLSPANAVMSPAHQNLMSTANAMMSPANAVMSPAHQNITLAVGAAMSPVVHNVMSPAIRMDSPVPQSIMSPIQQVMSPNVIQPPEFSPLAKPLAESVTSPGTTCPKVESNTIVSYGLINLTNLAESPILSSNTCSSVRRMSGKGSSETMTVSVCTGSVMSAPTASSPLHNVSNIKDVEPNNSSTSEVSLCSGSDLMAVTDKDTLNPGDMSLDSCDDSIVESCQLHLEPDQSQGFSHLEGEEEAHHQDSSCAYLMNTPKKFIPIEDNSRSPTVYSDRSFSNSPGFSDATPTKCADTPTKSAVEIMAAVAQYITTTPTKDRPLPLFKTPSPHRAYTLTTPKKTRTPGRDLLQTPIKYRNIAPKPGQITPTKPITPLKKPKSPRRRILQQKAKAILPKGFVVSTYSLSPTKKAAASLSRKARCHSSKGDGLRKILPKPSVKSKGQPAEACVEDETDDMDDVDVLETDFASEYDTLDSEYVSDENQSAEEKENVKAGPLKTTSKSPVKAKRQRRWKKKSKPQTDYNDSGSDNEDERISFNFRFGGNDSQNEEEADDGHLAELMAASSTIRFAPKRLTLASDRKKNKSKAKLKREMSLQMLSDDLVQSDVLRDERDTAFAQAYLCNVKEVLRKDPEVYKKFLQVMFDFGKSEKTPVELYSDIEELLVDYPEVLQDFSGFLLPDQARKCGCLMANIEYGKARKFFRKLEVFFSKHPSHLQKILKVFASWQNRGCTDNASLQEEIVPLLRGQQHLLDEFMRFFSNQRPQESNHADDCEEVTLNEEDEEPIAVDDTEVVTLPEADDDDLYGTSHCRCQCHAVLDKVYARRRKHCHSCSMKVIRGKLYMQTMEKTLRPVKVVFQGSPPPIFKRQRSKPEYLDAQVKGEDGNSSEGDPMADQGPEADLDQTEIQAKEPPLKSKRFVKHRQKHLKVNIRHHGRLAGEKHKGQFVALDKLAETVTKVPEAPEKVPEAPDNVPEASDKIPEAPDKVPEAPDNVMHASASLTEKSDKITEKTPRVTEKTVQIPAISNISEESILTSGTLPGLAESQNMDVVRETLGPTDFSVLRKEIKMSESLAVETDEHKKPLSVASEGVRRQPSASISAPENDKGVVIESYPVHTRSIVSEPTGCRPAMRVASKDIRMTQINSDSNESSSQASESNSLSSNSNDAVTITQSDVPQNAGCICVDENSEDRDIPPNPIEGSSSSHTLNNDGNRQEEEGMKKDRIILRINLSENVSHSLAQEECTSIEHQSEDAQGSGTEILPIGTQPPTSVPPVYDEAAQGPFLHGDLGDLGPNNQGCKTLALDETSEVHNSEVLLTCTNVIQCDDSLQEGLSKDSCSHSSKLLTESPGAFDTTVLVRLVRPVSDSSTESLKKEASEQVIQRTDSDGSTPSTSDKHDVHADADVRPVDTSSWTRDDDKEILLTCKQLGPTEEAFQKIAKRLCGGQTTAQVEQRFLELMNLFKSETSFSSDEEDDEA